MTDKERIEFLESQNAELRETLVDMVGQHCAEGDYVYAFGLSANRNAIETLQRLGLIKNVTGIGRCIKGEWV